MNETSPFHQKNNHLYMKKKKHLETEFLKFLLEQQSQNEEEPIVEEPIEDDEVSETEEEEPIEDDEKLIEKLTLKYKNLKREYDNQLFNRKRR